MYKSLGSILQTLIEYCFLEIQSQREDFGGAGEEVSENTRLRKTMQSAPITQSHTPRIIHVSTTVGNRRSNSRDASMTSTYHRRVMEFYCSRKQHRRQQRREAVSGSRAASNEGSLSVDCSTKEFSALPMPHARSLSYQPPKSRRVINTLPPKLSRKEAFVTQAQVDEYVAFLKKKKKTEELEEGGGGAGKCVEEKEDVKEGSVVTETQPVPVPPQLMTEKPPMVPSRASKSPNRPVTSKGEEKETERSRASMASYPIGEIGDVCRHLQMCIASAQKKLISSMLVSI